MAEVQKHGFDFENWVKETFFVKSHVDYTEKWDVPSALNISTVVPGALQRLPVSIKTCQLGKAIYFGDALRQSENQEDFLLIVGFWKQSGVFKNFVAVEAAKVTVEDWRTLFLPLFEDDIIKLDAIIKDRSVDYWETRRRAKETKKPERFKSARIVLNPKIDSKEKQRRLQCSLPSNVFWNNIAKKAPYENNDCELFGEKVPNPFLSSARSFNREQV